MSEALCGRAATFSKHPGFFGRDYPVRRVIAGYGANEVTPEGRVYLSWVSGLGAILLGQPNAMTFSGGMQKGGKSPATLAGTQWARRVNERVWNGAGFSLPHALEARVADKLVALLQAHVPGWLGVPLGVRFGLSGSDATTMAVRLARAVTGRERLISIGYHGWGADFVACTPPAHGVLPQQAFDCAFADLTALEDLLFTGEKVAAVIVEDPPQPLPVDYYPSLRRWCDEAGALLILDEVVTGFRYGLGGAAGYYGIRPDIACYGKALGNGIPISAIVFAREMGEWFARQDPVFVSSTHFGNAVSLAAADAFLDLWDEAGVDHVWAVGRALSERLTQLGYTVVGLPPRFLVKFADENARAYFIQAMAEEHRIIANRPWFPSLAHGEAEVARTAQAAGEVMSAIEGLGPEVLAALMKDRLPAVLFGDR